MAFNYIIIIGFTCLLALTQAQQQQQHKLDQSISSTNMNVSKETTKVLVQTKSSGLLIGVEQPLANLANNNSSTIYKFLGVPYAQPPVGELRFKRPVELMLSSSTKIDASKYGKMCPQFRHLARFISPLLRLDSEHQTSEDCLHLNIYVPSFVGEVQSEDRRLEASKQLPVIVWIPGEGFDFADARQFDGSYLAQQSQSIVITVQYRVGVLGFLDAPKLGVNGNMGLYDQLEALRWIRHNVNSFGGDSSRVTLMGRFSGSMSISTLLTASNENLIRLNDRPLFSRAAMLSGVAVDKWIIEAKSQMDKLQSGLVEENLCIGLNETLECIQDLPVDKLVQLSGYGWKLVVDNELIGQGGPIEAIKRHHLVDGIEAVLLGETETEGTLCLYRHMLSEKADFIDAIETDRLTGDTFYQILEDDSQTYFKFNSSSELNPMRVALEGVLMAELDNDGDNNDNDDAEASKQTGSAQWRQKYLEACSSFMVKSHSNRFKRHLQARNLRAEKRLDKKSVELYHYELRYKPSFSLAPSYIKSAAHGDDVPLIFGLVYGQQQANEADLLMTRKMMAYLGNFVHGNHPLLQQHAPIQSSSSSSSSDEHDSADLFVQDFSQRRDWTSTEKVYPLELSSQELQEHLSSSLSSELAAAAATPSSSNNLRLLLVLDRPSTRLAATTELKAFNGAVKTRLQGLLELRKQQQSSSENNYLIFAPQQQQQQQQHLQRRNNQQQEHISADIVQQSSISLTTPQQMNHHHHHQQQQQLVEAASMPGGDYYLMSSLLIGACVAIFALTSFCIVLSLMVFRYNLIRHNDTKQRVIASGAGNQKRRFDSSSSSSACNICIDGDCSQRNSIDAVLSHANHAASCQSNMVVGGQQNKKDQFCNVFAKLRQQSERNHQANGICKSHHLTATTPPSVVVVEQETAIHQRDSAQNASSH